MRNELEQRIAEVLECIDGKRTIPVSGLLGPPSNRLAYVLAIGEPGDELSDDEIEQITRLEGDRAYHSEQSAIRHVRRSRDVWWKRSPKEGVIRCLDAKGRVNYASDDVRSAGRRAKRAVKAASVAEVPPELLSRRDLVLAQAGAMATLASAEAVKRIAGDTKKKAPPEIAELKALVARLG